jgi:hypothetical protein
MRSVAFWLAVPRADHLKPNRDFPAERYALFRRAS